MMNSNSEVVSEQRPGLFNLFLHILKLPIYVIEEILKCFIPRRLFKKELNNCLPGKVVLITGASGGLGEALAHIFYKAGCKVVLAARRQDELERVRKDLMNVKCNYTTHQPVVISIDVSDLNSIPLKVKEILDIHGHIDILVNNAGMSLRSEIVNTDMKVDIQIMLVNYFGAVALTKAVLPSMMSRKQGRVVFISSVQGKFGIPERSSYAASKHALQAFSESLRAEVARFNLKVTIFSAGYVKTNLSINAVTGSGDNYGKLDKDTENGVDPMEVSQEILQSVLNDEKDVFSAHFMARFGYKVHYYFPSLFFWIMEKRAEKLAMQNQKTN